jgi:hypothetical protein
MKAQGVLYAARNALHALKSPSPFPPGHFYSPIPSKVDIRRAANSPDLILGIDIRETEQVSLINQLADSQDIVYKNPRYTPDNPQFSHSDAAFYQAFLAMKRPRRIVEVGSGHSSAAALDVIESLELDTLVDFVDPYPDRLHSILRAGDDRKATVHAMAVQDLPLKVFGALQSGDVLFIDSTHVGKAGSDVNYLLFEVLPRLSSGVYIHIHDMPWPFEYSQEWLRQGRAWNEAYLVRAFLMHNSSYAIVAHLPMLERKYPQELSKLCQSARSAGSLWLEKVS